MPNRHKKLIAELLAIYTRYTDREIEDALASINSGTAFGSFVDVATRLAHSRSDPGESRSKSSEPKSAEPKSATHKNAKTRSATTLQTTSDRLEAHLQSLQTSSDESARKLAALFTAAKNGEVLRKTAALRSVSATLGLLDTRKGERLSTLIFLLKKVEQLPPDQILAFIEEARKADDPSSSLQRWTDIIVRDQQ